jgi:hypothetical protein
MSDDEKEYGEESNGFKIKESSIQELIVIEDESSSVSYMVNLEQYSKRRK